ncbi:unnamed protein product [Phytomonas sp. Hart1]|nr:unnamed protein product [Phytomonas sp. Hart1]|eukprot:CCW67538.1 unnamed protein product [Phytomonas sp. isolate Hart1]
MDENRFKLCVGFVSLVSHDKTRVILPLAAACHSRMLQSLFQAVHLGCVVSSSRVRRLLPPPSCVFVREGAAAEEESCTDREFISFAAAYPYPETHGAPFLNVPLQCLEIYTLVSIADFLLRKTCERYVLSRRQSHLLEYQQSRENFMNGMLEVGRALKPFPEELLHSVDSGGEVTVLKNLDRTSQVDQLKAIQLLLGSDFLGC